jgi:outer membrane protein
MNKILIGLNVVLTLAVAYLFYKTSSSSGNAEGTAAGGDDVKSEVVELKNVPVTGKIAFVNIDSLNEKSLFVEDMVRKLKSSRAAIEASVENLGLQYQNKVKEYQASASAGIAPESELAAKAKEIQAIEREVQNKQIQMDNLALDLNEKNNAFQDEVRAFIKEAYDGKFDYVLTMSTSIPSMLYGSKAYDITQEVIAQLNERYLSRKQKNKK